MKLSDAIEKGYKDFPVTQARACFAAVESHGLCVCAMTAGLLGAGELTLEQVEDYAKNTKSEVSMSDSIGRAGWNGRRGWVIRLNDSFQLPHQDIVAQLRAKGE